MTPECICCNDNIYSPLPREQRRHPDYRNRHTSSLCGGGREPTASSHSLLSARDLCLGGNFRPFSHCSCLFELFAISRKPFLTQSSFHFSILLNPLFILLEMEGNVVQHEILYITINSRALFYSSHFIKFRLFWHIVLFLSRDAKPNNSILLFFSFLIVLYLVCMYMLFFK